MADPRRRSWGFAFRGAASGHGAGPLTRLGWLSWVCRRLEKVVVVDQVPGIGNRVGGLGGDVQALW